MYQPKAFFDIASDMVEACRTSSDDLTDFNIGSVVRTLLEAHATGIEDLYIAFSQGVQDAIPAALYAAFDFERLPAANARGKIRVTITGSVADFVLPAGSRLSTAGGEANFETDAELTILAGETVGEVSAVCMTSGVVGNVPANTITLLTGASLSVLAVTNPIAFSQGSDVESDAQMKARFQAFISSIARATPASLEYAARVQKIYNDDGTILEQVARVAIQEYAGYVRLFIYNGSGSTSNALVDQVQKAIDGYYDPTTESTVPGYRAAGVFVWVGAMAEKSVSLTASVNLLPGYGPTATMETAVRTALEYAIRTSPSGEPLTVAKLQNAVLATPGVRDVLITPAQSIACAANEALIPGTLTIQWT
jgi:uncharacterized phage protein gp47/JayE